MSERNAPEHPLRSALFTDLYELTMAQAYDEEVMTDPAVFELFFRKMPDERNFFIAAGIEDVIEYLENFAVTGSDIDYLRDQDKFSGRFLERFRELRFTGDVYTMAEGTPVFQNEPIARVRSHSFCSCQAARISASDIRCHCRGV